jgi:hypothetical protein
MEERGALLLFGVALIVGGSVVILVLAALDSRSRGPAVEPPQALVAGDPPTIVRTYRGAQQADTTAPFQRDAAELARYGYAPTTQSWAQGQWGCGAFLVALLLCIVILGILIFIYLLIVKPVGTLTVTYAKVAGPASEKPLPEAPLSGPMTLSDRLAHLEEARSRGLVTPEEHEAKRADILKNL